MKPNSFFEGIIDDLIQQQYAVVNGLFPSDVLNALKQHFSDLIEQEELRRARIGNQDNEVLNKQIRSDSICWIEEHPDNPQEQSYFNQVRSLSDYLNYNCFTGIQSWEFHYAKYDVGAFYKRHMDQFRNDDSRKFSLITYLNNNWKDDDGGELVMYLEHKTEKIKPEFGVSVIFRSDKVEHEVLPANRQRLSITGWLK